MVDRLIETFTSAGTAVKPNKRQRTPQEKNIDQYKNMKKQLAKIESPSLENLKQRTTFVCMYSTLVNKNNIDYYGSLTTIVLNEQHATQFGLPNDPLINIAPDIGDVAGNVDGLLDDYVILHYGLVMNGTSAFVSYGDLYFNYTYAVEELSSTTTTNSKYGMQCLVEYPVDDPSHARVVPDSWKTEPVIFGDGEPAPGTEPWKSKSRNLSELVAASIARGPAASAMAASESTIRDFQQRQDMQDDENMPEGEEYGFDDEEDAPQPSPSPPPPTPPAPAPAPAPDVDCENKKGKAIANWKRYSKGQLSTYDVHKEAPEIAHMWEIYSSGGKEMCWGRKFETSRPPGLPQSFRPTLSRRSSIQIFNFYANQTNIPDDHLFFMKLLMIGLAASESGFHLGYPAATFDLRGRWKDGQKGPNEFCKESIERGEEFGTPFKNRIQTVIDGYRYGAAQGPGQKGKILVSAIGCWQPNFDAWNNWRSKLGLPNQHIIHSTIKEECQIPLLFYYSQKTSSRAKTTVKSIFDTHGATVESVYYALATITADHHGGRYRNNFDRYVRYRPGQDYSVFRSGGKFKTNNGGLLQYCKAANGINKNISVQRFLGSFFKKQVALKQALKQTTILGDIMYKGTKLTPRGR